MKQNSSSEVGVPVPSQAESWEPDEFQRAMAAGSTIPLEPPLLLENLDLQTSIDSQSTAGQGQAKPVLGVPDSDSSSEEDSSPLPVTPSVQPHEKPSQY